MAEDGPLKREIHRVAVAQMVPPEAGTENKKIVGTL